MLKTLAEMPLIYFGKGEKMNKSISIIVALSLLLIIGCTQRKERGLKQEVVSKQTVERKGYSDITPQELMQKIENKERFILLDVRTKEEYAQGFIKGSVLIPYTEIASRHGELGCKCHEVVVYCKSGHRSAIASKTLVKLGFHRVKNLLGGIKAWKKAGGEVVTGE